MKQTETTDQIIYSHPWEPFVPAGARILVMGTFPPGDHRWAMDFYYPNPTNDFWKMMGIVFLEMLLLYTIRSRAAIVLMI